MSPCVGLATLCRVASVGPFTLCRALLCATLLFHVAAQGSDRCPEKCRCPENNDDVIFEIRCSNVSLTDLPSGGDLEAAFFLVLSLNNITTLKNNAFKDRNLLKVERLYLEKNGIKTVEEHAFRGLSELKILNLGFNDITNISSTVFETNTRLEALSLSGNENLQLPESGFHLMDLDILSLKRCGLKSIPPKFFHSTPNLEYIFLRWNHLSSFDSRLVSPLTKLSELDLRDNAFTSLQPDLFRLLPQSLIIHFSANPVECDCAMFDTYVLYHSRRFHGALTCEKPVIITLGGFLRSTCNKTIPFFFESTTLSTTTTSSTTNITEEDDESITTTTEVDEDVTTTDPTLETTTESSPPVSTPSWHPWWVVLSVVLALVVIAGITCVIVKKRRKSKGYTVHSTFTALHDDEEQNFIT